MHECAFMWELKDKSRGNLLLTLNATDATTAVAYSSMQPTAVFNYKLNFLHLNFPFVPVAAYNLGPDEGGLGFHTSRRE